MAITKITDYVLGDRAVNVSKLDVTAGSNGQVLSIDGSGNLVFIDNTSTEVIQDASAAMILAGTHTNISVVYDDTNNKLSLNASGAVTSVNSLTGAVVLDTDDIAEGSSNLYYTDARADARAQLKIDTLVDSAPATLDTLNELAAALGDDENFSTTITNSLAGKEPTITAGTTSQYYRGDKSFQTLDTSAVTENTNLYYTDTRARLAISVSGDLTYNSSTGVISTQGLTSSTTDDLAEGTNNLYHTTTRARQSISASGDLAYNSSTGVISFSATASPVVSVNTKTGSVVLDTDDLAEGTNKFYTDTRARESISVVDVSGDGSLAYNNTTGVITYTGPSASEVRAHLSAGTGVTYTSGEFSIGQSVGTTDNVQFNNVQIDGVLTSDDITSSTISISGDATITGDLTVSGNTTYISTTDLLVADSIITLNSDWPSSSAPTENAGIEVSRGTQNTVGIRFNESIDKWQFTNDGLTYSNIGSLSASDSDDLSEGTTNLYYTDARSRGAISITDSGGDGSLLYNSTTGVITYTGPSASEVRAHLSASGSLAYNSTTGVFSYTTPNTIASLGNHDTDDLAEGTNNLYFTSARSTAQFNTDLAASDTDDLSEGTTNLYYTTARWDTKMAAADTDDLSEGSANLYYTQARADARVDVLRQNLLTDGGEDVHFNNLTNLPTIVRDTITGDGSTTTFTLSATPGSANALIVTISGATQTPTTDYTVSSNTITFTSTLPLSQVAEVRHVGYQISGGTITTATDSQLLDGLDSTQFLRSDTNDTMVGDLTMTGDIVPTTDDTYDLGSSSKKWANVYGHSIEATFADLAERYATDAPYEPGTVVVFGGEAEITTTTQALDVAIAGVISTDPAVKLNADAGNSHTHPYVALRGRVPCKVIGPVNKGDLMVTSDTPGFAKSVGKVDYGVSVFAKSITTDLSGGEKTVEVVIL
jgi:hypothetical protein